MHNFSRELRQLGVEYSTVYPFCDSGNLRLVANRPKHWDDSVESEIICQHGVAWPQMVY